MFRKDAAEAISGISPNDDVTAFAQDADVWDQDTMRASSGEDPASTVTLLADSTDRTLETETR